MTGFATRTWRDITIPAPGIYQLDSAHKRIGFVARHMMVSPVRGEFTEATAQIHVAEDPLQSSVAASIQTATISTGAADRDAHLSSPDFLDVTRYPTLEYRSTGITWQEETDPIFFWARLRKYRADRRGDFGNSPPPATRTAGTSSGSTRRRRSTARTMVWSGTSPSRAAGSWSGRKSGSSWPARRSASPEPGSRARAGARRDG